MPINAQCQWHLTQNTKEITADLVYDFDLETTQYMHMYMHMYMCMHRPQYVNAMYKINRVCTVYSCTVVVIVCMYSCTCSPHI